MSPLTGTGNGSVVVTVPPISSAQGLSYDVLVAGVPLHITQSGLGCSIGLGPTSAEVSAGGGTDTIAVTTAAGCQYNTLVGPAWVSVTSGGSGSGPGTLVYTVEANSATTERSGALTIGGTLFNVHQLPAACSITVDTSQLGSPYNNGAAQTAGLVGIAANGNNCPWSASSAASWARLSQYSGTSGVSLRVTLDANNTVLPRSTDLTIAGQVISITQNGTQCTYGLQSADGSVPSGGGLGTVGVVAPSACTWNATASSGSPTWLHVLGQGGAGTSNVLFSADANAPGAPERSGSISVAGSVLVGNVPTLVTRVYSVTQAAAPCAPTLGASSALVTFPGGPGSVGFSAGCTPSVLSYADWITGLQVSGNSVLYSVQPNPVALPRTGAIQIGDKTFTVNQEKAFCAYRLSSYGSAFGQAGGAVSLTAGVNSITCDVPARGTSQGFITFTSPPLPPGWPPSGQLPIDAAVAAYTSLTVNVRFGSIVFGNQLHSVKLTSW
ncbi:MAG: BACON domain-containing carbohydrate-binding protein [Vicinamibacterales bacterium]